MIDKLASTIEVKQSDHDILDKEIVKLSAENKQFYNQAIKYTEIINKADTLRTQRDIIEENLGQTRATLIELKGSFRFPLLFLLQLTPLIRAQTRTKSS